ncbi:MAG: repair protein [Gemmatimonadetes bacterium]|nr:repair protein [Gemmatimonadota bacterium]
MASIWKGAVSFGLVNIPVELHSAVKAADHIAFRQLDRKTHKPIKLDRVSTKGESVPWKDIVKGYEISRNKFVIMDDKDFDAVKIKMSRVLEITDFVPGESIDPRFFDMPYFLVPQEGGEKAYALLRDALEETEKVGIGTFALRQKQHLAAIKPTGNALVLEIMRFDSELVDPRSLKLPTTASVKLKPQEKTMAKQLIAAFASEFDASKYKDTYQDELMRIIKAKSKGKELPVEEDEEEEDGGDVLDLVARLKASLEKPSAARRKPAAKKKTVKRRKSA